ncbi:hypothetical protein, partial [Burkholderia ubonensis]|uniref:hypothetical protein n=1 Tax=Burkholderia ubonensis TaxID=101571 RepID=UPI0012FA6A2E
VLCHVLLHTVKKLSNFLLYVESGQGHFLTRTLKNVGTEMSLHVLAYNLRRVLSILGFAKTMKAIRLASA